MFWLAVHLHALSWLGASGASLQCFKFHLLSWFVLVRFFFLSLWTLLLRGFARKLIFALCHVLGVNIFTTSLLGMAVYGLRASRWIWSDSLCLLLFWEGQKYKKPWWITPPTANLSESEPYLSKDFIES